MKRSLSLITVALFSALSFSALAQRQFNFGRLMQQSGAQPRYRTAVQPTSNRSSGATFNNGQVNVGSSRSNVSINPSGGFGFGVESL